MEAAAQHDLSVNLMLENGHRKAIKRIAAIEAALDKHRGEFISIRPYQQPIIIGTVGTGLMHVDLRQRVVLPIAKYVIPAQETRAYLTFQGPIGLSPAEFSSILVHETDDDRIRIGDYEVLTNLPPENHLRSCELFQALGRDISHPFLEAKRLKEAHGW